MKHEQLKATGKLLAAAVVVIYLASLQLLVAEQQTQEQAFKKYDAKCDSLRRAHATNSKTMYDAFQHTHDSIVKSAGTAEQKGAALDELFNKFRNSTDSLSQANTRAMAAEYQKLKSVFIDNSKQSSR